MRSLLSLRHETRHIFADQRYMLYSIIYRNANYDWCHGKVCPTICYINFTGTRIIIVVRIYQYSINNASFSAWLLPVTAL